MEATTINTPREWTRRQAAEELSITEGAIRALVEDMERAREKRGVSMPRKANDGGYRFTERDLDELRIANGLRGRHSHDSIVVKLSELPPAEGQIISPPAVPLSHPSNNPTAVASPELGQLVTLMQQLVEQQAGQTFNAEQLAGELGTALVPQVVQALTERNEVTLQLAAAVRQLGQVEGELTATARERDALKAELEIERSKGWFARLLGR